MDTASWPRWARLVARLRRTTDRGVGDTIQRLAARIGGERYKALRDRLGVPCACVATQDALNVEYPYTHPLQPVGTPGA